MNLDSIGPPPHTLHDDNLDELRLLAQRRGDDNERVRNLLLPLLQVHPFTRAAVTVDEPLHLRAGYIAQHAADLIRHLLGEATTGITPAPAIQQVLHRLADAQHESLCNCRAYPNDCVSGSHYTRDMLIAGLGHAEDALDEAVRQGWRPSAVDSEVEQLRAQLVERDSRLTSIWCLVQKQAGRGDGIPADTVEEIEQLANGLSTDSTSGGERS